MKTKQPECPECEKLSKVSEESNKIGDFLTWLIGGMDFELCKRDEHDNLRVDMKFYGDVGINKLLALYYDIDLDKVEKERRALLKWLQNEAS